MLPGNFFKLLSMFFYEMKNVNILCYWQLGTPVNRRESSCSLRWWHRSTPPLSSAVKNVSNDKVICDFSCSSQRKYYWHTVSITWNTWAVGIIWICHYRCHNAKNQTSNLHKGWLVESNRTNLTSKFIFLKFWKITWLIPNAINQDFSYFDTNKCQNDRGNPVTTLR